MYPILFEFGPITVYSLWFFITVGFIAGSLIFSRLTKRNRVKMNLIADNSLSLFFWTLAVSRIVFIVMNTDLYFYQFNFESFLSLFKLWDKGLSFWGAILGWFSGIAYLSRKNGESVARLLDSMAPALLIGMAIGSFGAFLDGLSFGSPTEMPWGMSFRSANVKYIVPIHPTQLYSLIYTAASALLLLRLIEKLRGRLPGFVAEVALALLSTFKFVEEFFRGDDTVQIFSMRLPQLCAFAGIVVAFYLIYSRATNRMGGDPDGILKAFIRDIVHRRKDRRPDYQETSAAKTSLQNQASSTSRS